MWCRALFSTMILLMCEHLHAQSPESDGRAIYLDQCVNCHHYDGRGIYYIAHYRGYPPPDLTTLAANNSGQFPESRVRAVLYGSTTRPHALFPMPNFGQSYLDLALAWRKWNPEIDPFADAAEQIDAIVAYLKALQADELSERP